MATVVTRSALDERPLPWVIALKIAEDSEIGIALKSMGGEVVFCSSLGDVRQSDFHFVICQDTPSEVVHEKLNVLQLCNEAGTGWMTPYTNGGKDLFRIQGDKASLFEVTGSARGLGLESLINSTILANLSRASNYKVLKLPQGPQLTSRGGQDRKFTPLLQEREGDALAGYLTNAAGHEWWLLPAGVKRPATWLGTVFDRWKKHYPDYFSPGALEPEDTWMTLAERQAHDEIRQHSAATTKLLAAREVELEGLKDSAKALTEAARDKEARLLFATGDELVEAVADVLVRIGFEVTDADEVAAANNSAKREDLQVRLARGGEWISLVEVKGKTRAAATSDLAQLAKAGNFYEARTGHKPDSEWYIVNANKEQPPSSRPIPLGTSRQDVDYYAAAENAAVIDTRELFILLREVESGSIEPAAAQESLRSARGIYTAPRGSDLVPVSKQTAA